jgi:hypothetical protein
VPRREGAEARFPVAEGSERKPSKGGFQEPAPCCTSRRGATASPTVRSKCNSDPRTPNSQFRRRNSFREIPAKLSTTALDGIVIARFSAAATTRVGRDKESL